MAEHASGTPQYSFAPDRPPRLWLGVLLTICAILSAAIAWSSFAQVDELSRAEGRVVPTSKTQVIQTSEAGVVTEILVRRGEQVEKDQLLVRLDDTTTTSSEGEIEARVRALQAQIARLRLEADGEAAQGYDCPDEVRSTAPEVCENEASLLVARQQNLDQNREVLKSRVEQRQGELSEALTNQSRYSEMLELAQERLRLVEPAARRKLVSQTDFIAAKQDVSDAKGQKDAVEEAIGRLRAAVAEAELQVGQVDYQFRQEALSELTERLAELSSAQETLRGASDRVSRTDIRSPVDGIVNELSVTTIGGFVSPGERILDIVPVDDLLVEARLKPSDVAFVRAGQAANVKFSAYDFSIYGGLSGEVRNVSADSIVDPDTRETYYLVLIKTADSFIRKGSEELPVLPGMVASVEILTGKKTVLQYLLKPVNKARDEALRER